MQNHRVLRAVCAPTVSFLLIGTTVAWSQEGSYAVGKQTGERQWHGMMASPEERTDRLTKALNLSGDQKTKVLSMYQDEQKQMMDLKLDKAIPADAKHDKMQQIHQTTMGRLQNVLTPDQLQKFDALQRQKQEKRDSNKEHAAPPPQL
jgi:Spy/CpxP family protein refolding chaperone